MSNKNTSDTVVILILLGIFLILFRDMCSKTLSPYEECQKKHCPVGMVPRYVYHPTRCICEIPAQ